MVRFKDIVQGLGKLKKIIEKIRMKWNEMVQRIEKSEKIKWNGMIRMGGANVG